MLDVAPVRLYGKRGCPVAYSIRDFLQRSDVPFEWIELRDDEQARKELGVNNVELYRSAFPFASSPTVRAWNIRLCARSPRSSAGSVALVLRIRHRDLWGRASGPKCRRLWRLRRIENRRGRAFRRWRSGGHQPEIENYLGFPRGISGADLAERAREQDPAKFGAEILLHRTGVRGEFCPGQGHPRVGDWVLAVGNPFGLGGTVTAGIISAHNRDIGSGPYDYLQIDAAVNRGNSGGPSFDLDGKVVGVNTAIFSPSGGNVGIAFAVPAALVQEVVTQLKATGTVDRGWLGVVIQNVSDDIADSIGMKEAKGAMITKVTEDGPAAKEDLKAGDVIVEVNGEKIEDLRDLARKIAELHPNTPVKLSIVRYGEKREVDMKLGASPIRSLPRSRTTNRRQSPANR